MKGKGMTVRILGVEIDRMTFATTLDQIEGFIHHGQAHQVVTINPEFIMRAQSDHGFRRVLNNADLAVPDGAGLLWATRFLAWRERILGQTHQTKNPILKERVTGTDLLPALAQRAAKRGWKLYLLGSQPGIAERAAQTLKSAFPKLKIVGTESGPLVDDRGRPISDDQASLFQAVCTRIKSTKPDLLFVAFGAPKQDLFIAHYKETLNIPVMMGVGGAFDFLAGRAHRAPVIFRLLWLEWLWRLLIEPWRLGRIWTAVIRFPLAVLFQNRP